ncbi:hypothetical protein P5W99_07425 [Paraburkholderia sp. A3BS-1L]|uniref:hypothetical protein n=1 Tax=Paraburkholderia sp. A3BS-1L TaxID=3028375 RepID=UPI003DA8EB32
MPSVVSIRTRIASTAARTASGMGRQYRAQWHVAARGLRLPVVLRFAHFVVRFFVRSFVRFVVRFVVRFLVWLFAWFFVHFVAYGRHAISRREKRKKPRQGRGKRPGKPVRSLSNGGKAHRR